MRVMYKSRVKRASQNAQIEIFEVPFAAVLVCSRNDIFLLVRNRRLVSDAKWSLGKLRKIEEIVSEDLFQETTQC